MGKLAFIHVVFPVLFGPKRKKLLLLSVGNQDILIAGICITHDLPLITRNTAHFSRISRLRLFGKLWLSAQICVPFNLNCAPI